MGGYESGFFTNRRGRQLFFAIEQAPGVPDHAPAWIVCSPVLEEKTVAHGVCRRIARALADGGARALRFDYEGHGDSQGDTAALGLEHWSQDVEDAAAWLRARGAASISLVGFRAGALIAAATVTAVGGEQLLAICPVLKGKEYLQELLRINLTSQLAVHKKVVHNREQLRRALNAGELVNILGWDVGRAFARSLQAADFAALINRLSCPVNVVSLVRTDTGPLPAALAALFDPPRVHVRGAVGVQFWDDPKLIDFAQEGLTQAAMSMAIGAVG